MFPGCYGSLILPPRYVYIYPDVDYGTLVPTFTGVDCGRWIRGCLYPTGAVMICALPHVVVLVAEFSWLITCRYSPFVDCGGRYVVVDYGCWIYSAAPTSVPTLRCGRCPVVVALL